VADKCTKKIYSPLGLESPELGIPVAVINPYDIGFTSKYIYQNILIITT